LEDADEDCAISTTARNYSAHATRVTFDDVIELAHYLTEVEFPSPNKSLHCSGNPDTVFLAISGNLPPQEIIRNFYLKRVNGRSCPCVSRRDLKIFQIISTCIKFECTERALTLSIH